MTKNSTGAFRLLPGTLAAMSLAAMLAAPASAQGFDAAAEAAFFKGKTVTLVVGFGTGGGYDTYARLLARHYNRHLPGKPNMIVQNMPGASGIKSGNYIYEVAPRDGTAISLFNKSMPTYEALERPGVRFKSKELNWLGSIEAANATMIIMASSGIKTMADAGKREVILGAVSTSGSMGFYPAMTNRLLGTKFKIISGYPGSKSITLAMERGEVEGVGSPPWTSWLATTPDWVRDKKINVLAQLGLKKDPSIPGPLLTDLAKDEKSRKIIEFVSADIAIGRPVVAPPKVPAGRVQAMRRSFDAALKDPKLLADAKRLKLDIGPDTGETVARLVSDMIDTPKEIIAEAKDAIEPKGFVKKELKKKKKKKAN
jgi:tripartite-type tricarboxylate transporter receptor subunit TctC